MAYQDEIPAHIQPRRLFEDPEAAIAAAQASMAVATNMLSSLHSAQNDNELIELALDASEALWFILDAFDDPHGEDLALSAALRQWLDGSEAKADRALAGGVAHG